MKKMKMFGVCIVLCCLISVPIFAEERDNNVPNFAKIIRIKGGNTECRIDNEFNENGFSAEIVLPEQIEKLLSDTKNREEYILHLFFDEQPLNLIVLNNDEYYTYNTFTWSDDYTDAQITIPEGTYDIIVEYYDYTDTLVSLVIKEGVILDGNLDLTVESADAIYTVEMSPVDENGEAISLNDQILGTIIIEITTPMQSYPMTISGITSNPYTVPNYIKQSPVSENYSVRLIQLKELDGKIYQVTYNEYSDVSSDIEVTNDPMGYHDTKAAFSFNPGAGQQYFVMSRVYIEDSEYTASIASDTLYPIEDDEVVEVYVSNTYDSENYFNFAFSFGIYTESGILPEMWTPFYYLTNEEEKIACTWDNPPASNDIVMDDGEQLNFSKSIPYLFTLSKNNNSSGSYSIGMDGTRIQGTRNQWFSNNQYMNMNTTYEVVHNDEIVSSGPFVMWNGLQDLSADTYSFILNYYDYYVEDMQGTAKCNLTFDLGADDPDSPVLTSVRIEDENGETTTTLPQNGNGTIEFTAADYVNNNGVHTYSPIDSAAVYYRMNFTTEWQELSIVEDSLSGDQIGGRYFTGDMSFITTQYINGTFIDLKVLITDETGNTYQATFVPALYISEEISVDDPVNPSHAAIISSIGPNPFNDNTTIRFSLSKPSSVRMDVYNVRGEKVRTLVDEEMEADSHTVTWDGKDNIGKQMSNGIYFCKIKADNETEIRKMMCVH